jgi:hypothetical protein
MGTTSLGGSDHHPLPQCLCLCMDPLAKLCFMTSQLGIPLRITPAIVFMDYSALRIQNCTLASTAKAQFAVSPAELIAWLPLKEYPHWQCMGIYFTPEGRSITRFKGIQQKQCLDPWPVQHSTQPLVARKRRRIMLKVGDMLLLWLQSTTLP